MLGPGWRTGYRACTGRTCRTRTGHVVGQAPCAARSPPTTCRSQDNRTRPRAPPCRWPRSGRTTRAECRSRAPARRASRGSAAGPIRPRRRAGTGLCGHASPIPPNTAADRPRPPRRSGNAPLRFWRGASSRLPRAAVGCPRPARRAAPVAARYGSAPTPSDRRR